jgi:uncharacterized protein YcbK (DUF882 family)
MATEPKLVDHDPVRRRVLRGAVAVGFAATGWGTMAAAETPLSRWLGLLNTHTRETGQIVYRNASGLITGALQQLYWLLRDHRTNEVAPIDNRLFDQLADLAVRAGVEPRYDIISGYRSPRTNAALQAVGRGVATHSLHTTGRAIDVRLQGVPCAKLRDLAIAAGQGGVGYYPGSDFVHLDTGRVRHWVG